MYPLEEASRVLSVLNTIGDPTCVLALRACEQGRLEYVRTATRKRVHIVGHDDYAAPQNNLIALFLWDNERGGVLNKNYNLTGVLHRARRFTAAEATAYLDAHSKENRYIPLRAPEPNAAWDAYADYLQEEGVK